MDAQTKRDISNFPRTLKLDSLCWFSQRRSRTPYFWRCAPGGGGYDPKIQTRPRFLYNALSPQVS